MRPRGKKPGREARPGLMTRDGNCEIGKLCPMPYASNAGNHVLHCRFESEQVHRAGVLGRIAVSVWAQSDHSNP